MVTPGELARRRMQLLRDWERQHGELTMAHRTAFIERFELDELASLPSEISREAISRHAKLIEIVETAHELVREGWSPSERTPGPDSTPAAPRTEDVEIFATKQQVLELWIDITGRTMSAIQFTSWFQAKEVISFLGTSVEHAREAGRIEFGRTGRLPLREWRRAAFALDRKARAAAAVRLSSTSLVLEGRVWASPSVKGPKRSGLPSVQQYDDPT